MSTHNLTAELDALGAHITIRCSTVDELKQRLRQIDQAERELYGQALSAPEKDATPSKGQPEADEADADSGLSSKAQAKAKKQVKNLCRKIEAADSATDAEKKIKAGVVWVQDWPDELRIHAHTQFRAANASAYDAALDAMENATKEAQ